MTAPDPREERLPRWVRDRLSTLRHRLENAERSRDHARLTHGPVADTDTLIDPYATEGPISLPKGERIRFIVGETPDGMVDREWIDASVERQTYRDGTQDTWLSVMGGDTLSVAPSSSNVIRIRVTDRF